MSNQQPISDDSKEKNPGCGRFVLGLLGAVFLVTGALTFYYCEFKPYYQKQLSKAWPTAKCEIKRAKLLTHEDEDSTSYSVDFFYTFTVDGQLCSGERYSFAGAHVSRDEVNRQREAFPVGADRECFYNPQDPNDCVLDRTNQDQGWDGPIVSLVFTAVGAGMFLIALLGSWNRDEKSISGSIKSESAKATRLSSDSRMPDFTMAVPMGDSERIADSLADRLDDQWSEPLKLEPAASRWGKAIAIGSFALLWNGFLAVFFFAPNGLFQNFGWAQIGLILFMIPFVLVGLLMLYGTLHSVLEIFNPTVEIAFSSGAVPLGGQVDVAWQVQGNSERISKLTMSIQAVQQATYQRGTSTVTDVEVFEKLPVMESAELADIAFGSTSVTIPADSMHTFSAKRNKIKWRVVVEGKVKFAPDMVEEFEFRVTPSKTQ